jgi:hypothetical protein
LVPSGSLRTVRPLDEDRPRPMPGATRSHHRRFEGDELAGGASVGADLGPCARRREMAHIAALPADRKGQTGTRGKSHTSGPVPVRRGASGYRGGPPDRQARGAVRSEGRRGHGSGPTSSAAATTTSSSRSRS